MRGKGKGREGVGGEGGEGGGEKRERRGGREGEGDFIAGIDRIVDMARAAVNIAGNGLSAVVIAKSEGEFTPKDDKALVGGSVVTGR